MPDPIEPTVPTGSGDADFDAALVQAAAPAEPIAADPPPAEPEPVAPPEPAAEDFTLATLENGQREMRTASGQVYRGKDDAELIAQLGKAQVAATRRIAELSRVPEPPAPAIPEPANAVDPTALAIADLMAPAFGLKSGKELVDAFAAQQQTAQSTQEYMAAQRVNMEAANFFRAVPEFSKAQADADKIDAMCQANGWAPTAANFEAAYYTLKAKGEMTAPAAPAQPRAPKNNMPPPPAGTAPANTGKGAPTEADLYAMTTEQLEALLTSAAPQ